MVELEQHLSEFISQNTPPERTIKSAANGISFKRFATICKLPGASDAVRQLLLPFSVHLQDIRNVDKQMDVVANVLKILISNTSTFVTLEQYIWLTRTTVAAQLLSGLSPYVSSLVRRLETALEDLDLATFNHSPAVVNAVAKSLREDIPLADVNLLHAIKKLALTNSPVLYYTAVALIFAGLNAITNPSKPTEVYRVQTTAEFLMHLEVLGLQKLQEQKKDLQNIYQLLKLLSLYQNMIIMRHVGASVQELTNEHKCFAQALHSTEKQRNTFRQWLETSSTLVQLFNKDKDEDFLILADLIQVDMIPLFDDLNQPDGLV